jgi:hypothetical protein
VAGRQGDEAGLTLSGQIGHRVDTLAEAATPLHSRETRGVSMSINDDDITSEPAPAGEGPADGGANPGGHDGGADGSAGEGVADGGANPGGHDGGADGSA